MTSDQDRVQKFGEQPVQHIEEESEEPKTFEELLTPEDRTMLKLWDEKKRVIEAIEAQITREYNEEIAKIREKYQLKREAILAGIDIDKRILMTIWMQDGGDLTSTEIMQLEGLHGKERRLAKRHLIRERQRALMSEYRAASPKGKEQLWTRLAPRFHWRRLESGRTPELGTI